MSLLFRARVQLKDYVEKESNTSSKLLSAQKEVKALQLMLTSEDTKDAIHTLRRDYERELVRMNDTIVYLRYEKMNIE